MSLLEILTAKGRSLNARCRVAVRVFDSTDRIMSFEEAYDRSVMLGETMARSSVYRGVRELFGEGYLSIHATRGLKNYYQIARDQPTLAFVDQQADEIEIIEAPELAQRIQALAKAHGYRLVGGATLPVIRASSAP